MDLDIKVNLEDVLAVFRKEPHIQREVLDTLALHKKISDEQWLEYCLMYDC